MLRSKTSQSKKGANHTVRSQNSRVKKEGKSKMEIPSINRKTSTGKRQNFAKRNYFFT